MINHKHLGLGLCAGLALALPHGVGRAQQTQAVQTVPSRIEAESYESYHDATAGNAGGAFRQDDVDIEATADVGGGFNVGWVDAGEHLDFTINVPSSGAYDFTARIATPYSGRTLAFVIDGAHKGSLPLPQTGAYQSWASATQTINLSAGQHSLRVLFETELINLNYIDVSGGGSEPPPPPPPGDIGDIVPVYGPGTPREPALSETLPDGTIVTHVGGRVRDRHAREEQFQAYQHYLPLYFQDRTFALEIIDPTPAGRNQLTFNMHTVYPHEGTNFRIFFRGIGTVAEYHINTTFQRIDDYNYTQTVSYNPGIGRAVQVGDLVEFEVGVFLRQPVEGRFNYYSRAWLYRVGQGSLVPWEGTGARRDSVPLASGAVLGGDTTQSINESDEPESYLMQMALNIAGTNAQPFVEGRRLHHTRFTDGVHSEPGNPVFSAHANKAGPLYNQSSCIGCHAGNGRSQPPESTGAAIHDMVFKVGTSSGGAHAQHGRQLQTRANGGATAEGEVVIASFQNSTVQATDGTVFSLQRPVFDLRAGGDVSFFSARTAPPLVGLGLLDAVHESTILGLADPDDANGDGISGRASVITDPQTGQTRLGRFGWKAERASLRQQIAGALAEDMGVGTSVFPAGGVELGDADLGRMEKYVALLAVAPQRFAGDPAVQAGANVFNSVGCGGCHTPSMTTSSFHPFAELRDQQIRPYTDLLLHDMGDGLASTLPGESATTREWRTAPLWNIGLASDVAGKSARYLHDGRARTLMEAILWHGGEAEAAKQRVLQLSATDRNRLITFLQSL